MIPDEATGLFAALEVEPVPIDHRAPAQNQPQGLDVVQSKVVDGLQPRQWVIAQPLAARRSGVVGRIQCPGCVMVASPVAGRPSDRVPKKIPSVRPKTAS